MPITSDRIEEINALDCFEKTTLHDEFNIEWKLKGTSYSFSVYVSFYGSKERALWREFKINPFIYQLLDYRTVNLETVLLNVPINIQEKLLFNLDLFR